MALPKHLYANLALVPDAIPVPARGPVEVKRARVSADRETEAHVKRKVDQACRVLDKLEARERIFADFIKEVQRRKALTCAKISRIEDEILTRMQDAGLTTVAGLRNNMRSQPAAEALEVLDENLIPREYMRPPKPAAAAPDKVAIKRALAQLEDVTAADWGCKLTSKISLIRS